MFTVHNIVTNGVTDMANEKQPTPGSRGERMDTIRKAMELKREEFAERLARKAETLGLTAGGEYTASRVSRLILGRQPLTLDDAAVVMAIAPKGFGWEWFVYGVAELSSRVHPTGVVRKEPSQHAVTGSAKPRARVAGARKRVR